MEPLKPEVKEKILRDRPAAQPQDIEEYERLLAERFNADPDYGPQGEPTRSGILPLDRRARRLIELHEKLFGPE